MSLPSRSLRAVFGGRHRLYLFPPLLLAAGCASYESKPLTNETYIHELGERSPSSIPPSDATPRPSLPAQGLSLADAKVVALYYNPTVRAARLKAQVPLVSATKAGLWDDPEISFDALRILETVEKPWIVGSSLGFTLPLSGRLKREKAKANAEGRAALVEAWATEQEIVRQLEAEWLEASAARRALEANREAERQLEEVVATTNRLESAGELITAEAVAFRVARARAILDSQLLGQRVAESELRIVRLLGLLPDSPVTLRLVAAPAPDPIVPDRNALLQRNPAVLMREAEYEVAEESLRLEVRRQYPDLTIGPAYGNEEGQGRLGLGFSLPLPVLNGNKRAIVEAEAQREAARAAWEESLYGAIAELAALEKKVRAVDERRQQLTAGVATLSDTQLGEARRLAEQGEVNALLLLEALQTKREVSLDLIEVDAERDRLRAAMRALAPENTFTPPATSKGSDR